MSERTEEERLREDDPPGEVAGSEQAPEDDWPGHEPAEADWPAEEPPEDPGGRFGRPGPAGSTTPCASCGAPADPQSLVCLECGGRVALRRQPHWASEPMAPVAALLVVVIVIGAGLFGFAVAELTSDGADGAAAPAAADREAAPAAGEGPAVVAGSGQPARTSEENAAPPASEAPEDGATATRDALLDWPADLRAHTVVLVTTSDRPAAVRVAREARKTGLEAGVLRSDPYNLGTGLWIVFSGRFTTPEGAARHASDLEDRYEGAYPQLVQRSQ